MDVLNSYHQNGYILPIHCAVQHCYEKIEILKFTFTLVPITKIKKNKKSISYITQKIK